VKVLVQIRRSRPRFDLANPKIEILDLDRERNFTLCTFRCMVCINAVIAAAGCATRRAVGCLRARYKDHIWTDNVHLEIPILYKSKPAISANPGKPCVFQARKDFIGTNLLSRDYSYGLTDIGTTVDSDLHSL